jgi:hypothetical protein
MEPREAQVQKDPVKSIDPETGEDLRDSAKIRLNDDGPFAVSRKPFAGPGHGIRVLVQADQDAVRRRPVQNLLGMTAPAERPVQIHAAWPGRQKGHGLAKKDGRVF